MDILQVRSGQIVDSQGHVVRLRGTCVGGWMNMENFINGYPGTEHELRLAMAEVLGPEGSHFFFDRLLDYFFGEDDIAWIAACGANVVRLPLNYRHFESDVAPFRYMETGFARLDQVVRWCGQHGLYVILDLHAVQGCQNPDWHCDNSSGEALFWQHPHFQERFVALWAELARRYQGNPTVAGYNVMNEPVCGRPHGRSPRPYHPDWGGLNRIYRLVVRAIRTVDPQHIVFLEGDWFSTLFSGLDEPFDDNLVYSSHNYTPAGLGPGPYPGLFRGRHWDRDYQGEHFAAQEGTRFAREHNVPLWVGEFGSVFGGPSAEHASRLRALDDQIQVLERFGAHWTTWTYKDVGVMGWLRLDPECEYLQVIRPVLQAKARLATDLWCRWLPPTPARLKALELGQLVAQEVGDPEADVSAVKDIIEAAALAERAASMLQPAFARCFRGMAESDLDRVLQSFALRNCRANEELVALLKKHLSLPIQGGEL